MEQSKREDMITHGRTRTVRTGDLKPAHRITKMDRVHGQPDIEERILLAAERLFAEQGFHGASLRDITDAAGCNVAAVNPDGL